MATNLIAQLMNAFSGDTLTGVASAIGESPSKTQTALGGVLPALIGGLAAKASTTDQATSLLNIIKTNSLDSGVYTDVAGAITAPGGVNSLLTMGRPLVDSLFGSRTGGLTDWVSSLSGIGRSSSSSLLGLALPLVLAQIGKLVKGAGWSASNLMSLLGDQRQFLKDAPPGLAGVLGLTDTAAARAGATEVRRAPVAAAAAATAAEPRRSNTLLWAVPLVALLIPLFLWMLRGRDEPRQATVALDGLRAVATSGVASLGPFVERRLPNNISLRIPANGVENKLIAYIEDGTQNPFKETWFSFDRLEFQTDSATLTPGASEQLRNVASILKAYPEVKVKIGGYTDNTADSVYNMNLSRDRANAAMNQIVNLGIDRSRLEAEGYGEQHPIADNATEEGRQRNRRVDIRVTDK